MGCVSLLKRRATQHWNDGVPQVLGTCAVDWIRKSARATTSARLKVCGAAHVCAEQVHADGAEGVGCGTSNDNGANAPCISMYLGHLGRVMFVVLTQGV